MVKVTTVVENVGTYHAEITAEQFAEAVEMIGGWGGENRPLRWTLERVSDTVTVALTDGVTITFEEVPA